MQPLADLILKWPLLRQILEGKDGTGPEAMSDKTRAMHARIDDAEVGPAAVCPYCGVGCGQLIYRRDGKLVSIEGDPESPIRPQFGPRRRARKAFALCKKGC